jgi:hypothetical protein
MTATRAAGVVPVVDVDRILIELADIDRALGVLQSWAESCGVPTPRLTHERARVHALITLARELDRSTASAIRH